MLDTTSLPPQMLTSIGSENMDFVVKATRLKPVRNILSLIAFSCMWLAITTFISSFMFGPVFLGQETHFTSNGVPMVAGPGNLKPLLWPGVFMGVFLLIGLAMLVGALYSLFKKGGYFVGTPTRLVHGSGDRIRSIDWEQFNGDIQVRGNAQKGDITLQMRTGKMVSQKNGPDKYVPETIYICGIAGAAEVEALCRKRIKENDPTPPAAMRGVV